MRIKPLQLKHLIRQLRKIPNQIQKHAQNAVEMVYAGDAEEPEKLLPMDMKFMSVAYAVEMVFVLLVVEPEGCIPVKTDNLHFFHSF
jgi:hypothetical protein